MQSVILSILSPLGLFLGTWVFAAFYVYGPSNFHAFSSGVFNALGDELLNLCILDQVSQNFFSGKPLLEGRFFYPESLVLAFSENLFFPSILYYPLEKIFLNKLIAYHVLILTYFSLNFMAMFLFTREFLRRLPSLLAASVYTFSMVRLNQLSHSHLLPHFFMPVAAWALLRYEKTCKSYWIYFAFFMVLAQLFTSIHLGLMCVLGLIVYAVWKVSVSWRLQKKRVFAHLAVGSLLLLGFLPIASQYYGMSHRYDITRSLSETRMYQANFMSYFSAPEKSIHGLWTTHLRTGNRSGEKHLFFGFTVLSLLGFGLREMKQRLNKNIFNLFSISSLFVFWLSLGPTGGLYSAFYYLFPPLQAIRVPARLGLLLLAYVSVAAGFGWQRVVKTRTMALGLTGLLLIENFVWVKFVEVPKRLEGATYFLSRQNDHKPVLFLPLKEKFIPYPSDQGEPNNNRETVRIYHSLFHGHPIANGYSGFVPPTWRRIADAEEHFGPSPELEKEIRRLSPGYLVIEKDFLQPSVASTWINYFSDRFAKVFEDDHVICFDTDRSIAKERLAVHP